MNDAEWTANQIKINSKQIDNKWSRSSSSSNHRANIFIQSKSSSSSSQCDGIDINIKKETKEHSRKTANNNKSTKENCPMKYKMFEENATVWCFLQHSVFLFLSRTHSNTIALFLSLFPILFQLVLLLLSFFGPFNHSHKHTLTFCSISVYTSNATPLPNRERYWNWAYSNKKNRSQEKNSKPFHFVCSFVSNDSIPWIAFRRFYLFYFSLYLGFFFFTFSLLIVRRWRCILHSRWKFFLSVCVCGGLSEIENAKDLTPLFAPLTHTHIHMVHEV